MSTDSKFAPRFLTASEYVANCSGLRIAPRSSCAIAPPATRFRPLPRRRPSRAPTFNLARASECQWL